MKPSKLLFWVFLSLLVCMLFGAWTTYDYVLGCTKCLAEKHVVEQQYFGIAISRRATDQNSAADYKRIFGHPCDHVFRTGSFGRSTFNLLGSSNGCGITGEGAFVRRRIEAVAAAYDAEHRLHDHNLTLETFQLIDTLMPPDLQLERRRDVSATAQDTTFLLGAVIRRAKTAEQWRAILDAARKNFSDTSNLPSE